MKIVVTMFLVMFLSGCMSYQANLKMPYQLKMSNVSIIDERPAKQKEQAIMSLNVMNCKYGSYQMGDENQLPGRIKLLENYLSYHKGNDLKGKVLILKSFTIHVNAAAQLKGQLSNMYSGLVVDVMLNKKVGCSREDLFGGYTLGEVKDQYPPLVAVIDLEIDGKVYNGRAVRSLESPFWGIKNPKWDFLIQDVIVTASESLVTSIDSNYFSE